MKGFQCGICDETKQYCKCKPVDNWISVECRLPEYVLHNNQTSDKCIVYFDGYVTIGYMYKKYGDLTDVFCTSDDTFDECMINVTHWQPLPDPPK